MTVRILITGSRDWADWHRVQIAIREALFAYQDSRDRLSDAVVVHGGARGADACAAVVAPRMGLRTEEHRADWARDGKAAGPLRNQRMVDLGADVCLAFPMPGSRGTWDCVRRAEAAGIPVQVIEAATVDGGMQR